MEEYQMYRLKKVNLYASEIAEYLNSELHGDDFIVNNPCSPENVVEQSLVLVENTSQFAKLHLNSPNKVLLIIPETDENMMGFSYIKSSNPRLDFIRVINEFFTQMEVLRISPTANISPEAKLDRNVSVGEHVVIGPDVKIGENTSIYNNVVIEGQVEIGSNCIIKDNTTIGSTGYNFVLDESGTPLQFPNIGKIIIGNNVWIGSNCSIESATLENTHIADNVKVDDLVQIGYSSRIGENSMITAGVIINRFVKIGKKCNIMPNVSISEKVSIGDRTIVGIGAVVLSELEPNSVYVGNPARFLKENN